ncbi:MAG: hypothetical protein J5761_00795, partial [Paludibacteraceae bacterium]|nr:hypothetical protein [Paludibacteraceae bacterium]
MKKVLFLTLAALFCIGCSKNERLLTSATGTIYECLVVMPDRPLSQASLSMIEQSQAVRPNGSSYQE